MNRVRQIIRRMLLVWGSTETIVFSSFLAKGISSSTIYQRCNTCEITNELECDENAAHDSLIEFRQLHCLRNCHIDESVDDNYVLIDEGLLVLGPIPEGQYLYHVLADQDGHEKILSVFQNLFLTLRHVTLKQ